MCKLEEVKDLLIDFIEEETEDGLECANGQELGMAIDMVKDLSKAMYHFKLIEAMDTTYGIENLEKHVKCLRKMAENATATERQTMIQHLTNAVTTIQQMR